LPRVRSACASRGDTFTRDHFADAASRRYQRKYVGLALHSEVHHRRSIVLPAVADGVGGALDAIDRETAQPVRFSMPGEAGPGERSPAVALSLEQLLPLPHHAEVAVVDDR